MSFQATIVADSICNAHRITSMLVTFPRYILTEFNTHRAFSRNSASSRAIPTLHMVQQIRDSPFIPIKWMKDHKGMQGTEYLDDLGSQFAREIWLEARDRALSSASALYRQKVTKQLINRLLEPFMWHTVLVTATEWENFFALRYDPAADIHMQEIARLMLEAMNASIPKFLKAGQWHMPFGDQIDDDEVIKMVSAVEHSKVDSLWDAVEPYFLKIATARCARTSYLTLGESPVKHDYKKDIKLHDVLLAAGHWSPFEHCARAMSYKEYHTHINGEMDYATYTGLSSRQESLGWCGNFRGWIQYRKTFANENRTDDRLLKKYRS